MQAKRIFFGPFGLFVLVFLAVFAGGIIYLQTEWALPKIPVYDDLCDERTPAFIFKINEALITHHYRGDELDPVVLLNQELCEIQEIMGSNGLDFEVQPIPKVAKLGEAMIQFEKCFMRAQAQIWAVKPEWRDTPDFGLAVAQKMFNNFGSSHTHLLPPPGYEQYGSIFEYGVLEYEHLGLMLVGWNEESGGSYAYVERVAPGSPADLAGLERLSIIRSITGFNASWDTSNRFEILHDALKQGRPCEIEFALPGSSSSGKASLVPEVGKDYPCGVFSSVRHAQGKKILCVAFYQFTSSVIGKVIRCIEDAEPDGIILDIRNNGGGMLPALDTMLSVFLPPETFTYALKGKSKQEPFMVTHDFFGGLRAPLVLLVNQRTFSTAEVFARVLSEYGRARIVGEPTWGGVECIGWDKREYYPGIPISRQTSLAIANFSVITAKGTVMEGNPLCPRPRDVVTPIPICLVVGQDEQLQHAEIVLLHEFKK